MRLPTRCGDCPEWRQLRPGRIRPYMSPAVVAERGLCPTVWRVPGVKQKGISGDSLPCAYRIIGGLGRT